MQNIQKTKFFQTAYILLSVLCDTAAAVLASMLLENNCTCIACVAVLASGFVCTLHCLSLVFELVSGKSILPRTVKTLKFSVSVILMTSVTAKCFSLPYTDWYIHQYCIDYAKIPTDIIFYVCSLLVIISFLFFDKKHRLPMYSVHFPVIFCLLAIFEKAFLQCKDISISVALAFILSAYIISFIFSVINGNRLNALFSLLKLALGK